jgi:Lrp/AsnC family leucine-responsive transcriptional regulator
MRLHSQRHVHRCETVRAGIDSDTADGEAKALRVAQQPCRPVQRIGHGQLNREVAAEQVCGHVGLASAEATLLFFYGKDVAYNSLKRPHMQNIRLPSLENAVMPSDRHRDRNRNPRLPATALGRRHVLDSTDRKILSVLHLNGRMTINDLAEQVGLSPSPCWTRVKRMEADGTIQGYAAVIDQAALGLRDIVFVEVTLEKHDEKMLERFGRALASIPQVLEAHLVTGDYDYLVKVAVADTADYERFLREQLYRIEGIRHSRSTFSLLALKRVVSVDPVAVRG